MKKKNEVDIENIEQIENIESLEEFSRKRRKNEKAWTITMWASFALAMGLSLFFDFNQDLFKEIETRKYYLLGGLAPCVVIGATAAQMSSYEYHFKYRADRRIEELKRIKG